MEADRVNNSGLNDLLPWEHTPRHSDGLSGVAVCKVLCTLTRGGEKVKIKVVKDDEKRKQRRERGFED